MFETNRLARKDKIIYRFNLSRSRDGKSSAIHLTEPCCGAAQSGMEEGKGVNDHKQAAPEVRVNFVPKRDTLLPRSRNLKLNVVGISRADQK